MKSGHGNVKHRNLNEILQYSLMPKKALILVDLENEWVDPRSEYYVGDLSRLVRKTNQLIEVCRKKKYKIIFTRHIEKGSQEAFAGGSKNVELMEKIDRKPSDTLITKYKISPFYKTRLERELKGIREIFVAGILTNLCVRSLVQDAYDRDFKITVVSDCCVSMDRKTHEFTIRDLKATRPEVMFVRLETFRP